MKMQIGISVLALTPLLNGCASTYSDLVSGGKLGAQDYMPAVYITPGNEGKYSQVLGVCRQAAVNRQVTSAQRAQLETITGSVEGLAGGAGFGLEIASQLKGFGLPDVDIGEVAGYGALAGLIGGLATSFSSGTSDTADATRDALLSCINATSNNGSLWQLLE